MRELLDRILEALDVDRAAAVLTDETQPIVAHAARGVETTVQREPPGAIDGLVQRVAHERGPIAIADVAGAELDTSSLGPAISSLLAVPLLDGGRVVGSIHVGTLTRRDFDVETVGLLRLAAERAGLAIGRTRLYERERRIAQELQRSLLPKRLPEVAGVRLGARYEPGENGTAVGGDWYDAVALPSGRIAIAIGDVVGRGIAAAATMGQMRSALRAILMQADDTGTMADRLNRFTLTLGSDEAIMTTVVLGILEPGTGTLHFTNAGHPPPLVMGPDGRAQFLAEPPSPPMGVLTTPRYTQYTRVLEPGSTLVLYTDGLVEDPAEVLDVGLERLRVAVEATSPDADADVTCERLLERLTSAATQSDDVTLLVVGLFETLGPRVALEVSNESGGLYAMRQTLRRWLVERGAGVDETEDVIMACNEACENAVEHGYAFGHDLFDVEFADADGELRLLRARSRQLAGAAVHARSRARPAAHAQADGRGRGSAAAGRHDDPHAPAAVSRGATARDGGGTAVAGARSASSWLTSRSLATVWRRMRETCIWLMPMTAPISACVMSSSKRIRSIARARGETDCMRRSSSARCSARSMSGSSQPSVSSSEVASPGSPWGACSDSAPRALRACIASRICSSPTPTAAASSLVVGERSSCCVRRASAPSTRSVSSWMPRGGRTIQV